MTAVCDGLMKGAYNIAFLSFKSINIVLFINRL